MKKLPLSHLLLLCLVMAGAGAWLYVQFRAWRGEEDANFLYLLGLGIGVAVAFLADHTRHPRWVLTTAVVCSLATSVFGTFWVASLERRALVTEFDREALNNEEFFVALEAYRAKYAAADSPPPFPQVAGRKHFTDAEWRLAEQRWNDKPSDERARIREENRSAYAKLAELGDDWVQDAFIGRWNLVTYAIVVILTGVIVFAVQRDQRRHRTNP